MLGMSQTQSALMSFFQSLGTFCQKPVWRTITAVGKVLLEYSDSGLGKPTSQLVKVRFWPLSSTQEPPSGVSSTPIQNPYTKSKFLASARKSWFSSKFFGRASLNWKLLHLFAACFQLRHSLRRRYFEWTILTQGGPLLSITAMLDPHGSHLRMNFQKNFGVTFGKSTWSPCLWYTSLFSCQRVIFRLFKKNSERFEICLEYLSLYYFFLKLYDTKF